MRKPKKVYLLWYSGSVGGSYGWVAYDTLGEAKAVAHNEAIYISDGIEMIGKMDAHGKYTPIKRRKKKKGRKGGRRKMREIKYRAWLRAWKEGSETYGGEMYGPTEESDEKRAVGFLIECDSGLCNDDFVWMQYTGLKDVDRQEIYSDFIVKFGVYVSPASSYEMQVGVIEMQYGTFGIKYYSEWSEKEEFIPLEGFYYEKKSHYVSNVGEVFDRSDIPKNDLEVIGDIHTTPELLQKQEAK